MSTLESVVFYDVKINVYYKQQQENIHTLHVFVSTVNMRQTIFWLYYYGNVFVAKIH